MALSFFELFNPFRVGAVWVASFRAFHTRLFMFKPFGLLGSRVPKFQNCRPLTNDQRPTTNDQGLE
jgi:hypothetical protein